MSIKILGIETSCDETSAAVVEDGRKILSNIIHSQIDIHSAYGGVVPEIASRSHIQKIDVVVQEALKQANTTLADISAIAVTYAPGLIGALLVGLNFAKALSFGAGLPLVPVHHIAGHIASNYLESEIEPPFISLVVSGGHTLLLKVTNYREYELLGTTMDDAIGEAFDKVARVLGLSYPGGRSIEILAHQGDSNAITFPKAFSDGKNLNFSYSGLKSAVLNYINKARMQDAPINNADIAASFQKAAFDVLISKSILACQQTDIRHLAVAGGVASNQTLRKTLTEQCGQYCITVSAPAPILCTDNAAMIAAQGYHEFMVNNIAGLNLNAVPNLSIIHGNCIRS